MAGFGGVGGVVQQGGHRLRHRYRTSGAARDLRDLHPHGLGVCSRCPPGFGVARRCTAVRDTVCHSCPAGYYAPGYSRRHSCWPCSRCGTHSRRLTALYMSMRAPGHKLAPSRSLCPLVLFRFVKFRIHQRRSISVSVSVSRCRRTTRTALLFAFAVVFLFYLERVR